MLNNNQHVNSIRILRVIFFALVLVGLVSAQTISGDLSGTVYDPSGAVISNARVATVNQATGVTASTVSTSTGQYRISNLPAGTYTVTVTAPGFAQAQRKDLQISLNQVATANITMQVSGAAQTVEVTEAATTLDTTTAQVQNTFGDHTAADLPMASMGAGVINLSLLNAGVATSGAVGAGTGPTVGGQRPRNNNYTIEGIDNNNGAVTGPVASIPNDAVAEFTVLQNQFSPEYGHSSGGQFNQIVKSGTNQFHGSAYEYFMNRNLDAADNLSAVDGTPLHPRYDNNRFGGTLGGPIKKNKLFFFVNYEYNPIGASSTGGLIYAPTAAGYSLLQGIPGINQTNLNVMKQYLGTAPTAASPASLGGSFPMVGPGNVSLGQQLPGATAIPIGQISISAPNYSNAENAIISIDDNVSDSDQLRFRFVLNRTGAIDTAANLPQFFLTSPTNAYVATFSEFHTFSPTLTNEFRLGYNRLAQDFPAGNFVFPGLDQFPNITLYELGGVNIGPDPNAPQFTYQNTFELTDNVALEKGNHSLKFGFDGWSSISPQSFTQRARGDYEWSYLSDYLFDYNPDYLAQRSLGNTVYYGNRFFLAGYANDSWRIKSNFTVNLGVRYEFETIPLSENSQDLNAAASVPGLIDFRSPKPQTNAIMPRIGIAWSPGKSGTTTIRAGFGRNFDVPYDNQGVLSLPPQLTTTVDVTGLNQGNFLANGGIAPGASGSICPTGPIQSCTGAYIPDMRRPESLQWNLGVQHVFARNYVVESRYLGTRGIDLPAQIQINRQPVVNASNALPVYFSAPSQSTLNGLTNTLDALTNSYNNGGNIVPGYLAAGFTGIVTSYQPWGSSTYHGWANQVTRRFQNGFQLLASYTLSHAIDNSTADVFSTYITPRRAQNGLDLGPEKASSALDHRNRITVEALYDWNGFKHGNWLMKNLVGNWQIAPVYTYQTGTLATVQSGVDSNLNGDTAGDRAIVNPSGTMATGSGTTPLMNSAGQTVAYLVTNPNAQYVQTPEGAIATGGRNTEHLRPIDDVDLSFGKSFSFGESRRLEFSARFVNIFNHPQYTGGYLSDVTPAGVSASGLPATSVTSGNVHNFLIPSSPTFLNPTLVFSSNPRSTVIAAKFIF
jgi:Carboxypeptidase regulatory-like domain